MDIGDKEGKKMNGFHRRLRPIWILTLINALFSAVSAAFGAFSPSVYAAFVSPLHIAESQGQDVTTLFVAIPIMLASAWRARQGSMNALVWWTGAAGYILYANMIYAYGGVYNWMFFVYLASCGLSLFTIIGGASLLLKEGINTASLSKGVVRSAALFFGFTALLLSIMWGAMAADAIAKSQAADANVIIVTDFIVVIPAFVLATIKLIKHTPNGAILSGILFIQAITLGISIVAGQFICLIKGETISYGLAGFFFAFTLSGVIIGFLFSKELKLTKIAE